MELIKRKEQLSAAAEGQLNTQSCGWIKCAKKGRCGEKGEEKTGKQQKGNTVKHEAERETAFERIRKRRPKERHLMSHVLKKSVSVVASYKGAECHSEGGTSWLAMPFL